MLRIAFHGKPCADPRAGSLLARYGRGAFAIRKCLRGRVDNVRLRNSPYFRRRIILVRHQ